MGWQISFFDSPQPRLSEATTVLDLVTTTAGLVSNAIAVDAILNEVRRVTAHLEHGTQPTGKDRDVLLKAYLQLEDYLVTRDPVILYTRAQLRHEINAELRAQLEAFEGVPAK